jgi:hypothetical protein
MLKNQLVKCLDTIGSRKLGKNDVPDFNADIVLVLK